MIRIEDLTCGYDGLYPIKGLSCELRESGLIVISGASGRGKTTLLRCMAGLIRPVSGSITGMPERLSMLFQEDRLLNWLTVEENVALVNPTGNVEACIDAVELSAWADKPIGELSGGMQRRVAIARALNYPAGALLMDEPMKGLDEALAERIMAKLKAAFPLLIMTAHGILNDADQIIELK